MAWLDGITDSMVMSLSKLREGAGDGQGGLACCGPWGHKESGTTEPLNCKDPGTDGPSKCYRKNNGWDRGRRLAQGRGPDCLGGGASGPHECRVQAGRRQAQDPRSREVGGGRDARGTCRGDGRSPAGQALRRRACGRDAARSLPPPRSCTSALSPGGGKQAATALRGRCEVRQGHRQRSQDGSCNRAGGGGCSAEAGRQRYGALPFQPSSQPASPQRTPRPAHPCSSPLSFPVVYSDGLVSDVHTAYFVRILERGAPQPHFLPASADQ